MHDTATPGSAPSFHVLAGRVVAELLEGREADVIARVRAAYLTHAAGESVNPASHFLRFPHRPEARIIALPAYAGGDVCLAGIKWIASFPGNVASGRPRASAVLVLNDPGTGYPVALLEAAAISAARTAASAALAARTLAEVRRAKPPRSLGVIGAGVIARTVCRYLPVAGIEASDVCCHDLDPVSANHLVDHLRDRGFTAHAGSLAEAMEADLVLLATTAPAPYVPPTQRLSASQLFLNISLRDLPPELLLRANNVLDDVDHCLTAQTSAHLAEQLTGRRDWINGTLADGLLGRLDLDPDKPTIFSPFGLGVLDIAVGSLVYGLAGDRLIDIPDFFGETLRW